jgi:hypothetical protein
VNNGATQWLEATAALCAAYNQRIILTANQPASGGSASWRIVGPPYLDGGFWEFGLVALTSIPSWTPGLPITFTSAIEGATGGGGGGVTNPMSADLASGNFNIDMAEGRVIFNHPTTTPSTYSINGVYNIDSGSLPYPVLRFSSSKAAGTQQKALTLDMNDGKAIWASQWEGNLPQEIETRQSIYTVAGQGAGAQTVLNCDTVNITPNFASVSAVNVTGNVNVAIPPTAGNNLTNKTYVDGRTQKATNVWYVAKNGSDSLGNGSAGSPFLTIQQAINSASVVASSTSNQVIYVAPGIYTENLTINFGRVAIIGAASQKWVTGFSRLNGSISVAVALPDALFDKKVLIESMNIAGSITDTSPAQHTLSIKDCYIISSTVIATPLVYTNVSVDMRLHLINTQISQDTALATAPVVQFNYGWVIMEQCSLYTTSDVNVVYATGLSWLYRCGLNTFESAGATNKPILLIDSGNGAVTAPTTPTIFHNIAQNAFVYNNATAKDDTLAGGIGLVGITGPGTLYGVASQGNLFALSGTSQASGRAYQYIAGAGGTPVLLSGNDYAFPNTGHKIAVGISRTALLSVP